MYTQLQYETQETTRQSLYNEKSSVTTELLHLSKSRISENTSHTIPRMQLLTNSKSHINCSVRIKWLLNITRRSVVHMKQPALFTKESVKTDLSWTDLTQILTDRHIITCICDQVQVLVCSVWTVIVFLTFEQWERNLTYTGHELSHKLVTGS